MSEDVFRWIVAVAVILAAIAFLVQAFVVLGLYRAFRQTQARMQALAEKAHPILDSSRRLLDETRPKIVEITNEALEITKLAKAEMARISILVADVSDRARVKVASLDAALTDAAGTIQETVGSVRHAVVRPLREVNGMLNGVRAALGALVHGRQEYVDRATQDEEMFI